MSTFDDMVSFVKSAWPAKKFIVPCLEGPAGIGKTAAVRKAADELGAGKVVTIIASQILPNEVSGITMPVVETKAMEIFDHFRLSSLEDGDVLFFDELLEADQLVLSACLTLIESRELMSGRKLPDVLLVAATNATIKPNMLKENIRQRFVWRHFGIDAMGTRKYIESQYGFDPGSEVAGKLVESGNEYNVLTPRSLDKMCHWIATAEDPKATADMIDCCWQSQLGTKLYQAFAKKANRPMNQVKRAIRASVFEYVDKDDPVVRKLFDPGEFKQSDLAEVMEVLRQLPEWDSIADKLNSIQLEEEQEEVRF